MKIHLDNIGKKFNRDWIFRKINHEFVSGNAYAVLGSNGSGKSTFLQVLSGFLSPSEGTLTFTDKKNNSIPVEDFYRHISFASPYLELTEEFSLREIFQFHSSLKPLRNGIGEKELIEITTLEKSADKAVKYFSSGMKQRVRLALAILSNTSVVFLDEPHTNLDQAGKDWYKNLVSQHIADRLIFVSSNHQKEEYEFCKTNINIHDYKSA